MSFPSGARQARLLLLLTLTAVLATAMAGCGEPLATPEPVFFQAAGSMPMTQVVAELAGAYREVAPLTYVDVSGQGRGEGLGTEYGLKALAAGEVQLALASWLPLERDDSLRAWAIARDGLAIIVHPDNPVNGLGLLQLRDLFSGRRHEWLAVGGRHSQGEVQLVSREEGSGARAAFEALAMEDQEVAPTARLMASGWAVVDFVAENENAIGYVSMTEVTEEVKALKVEGVLPSPETAAEGSYPLSHEWWLVAAKPPSEAVGAFVEFVLGPVGQEIVGRRVGRVR